MSIACFRLRTADVTDIRKYSVCKNTQGKNENGTFSGRRKAFFQRRSPTEDNGYVKTNHLRLS